MSASAEGEPWHRRRWRRRNRWVCVDVDASSKISDNICSEVVAGTYSAFRFLPFSLAVPRYGDKIYASTRRIRRRSSRSSRNERGNINNAVVVVVAFAASLLLPGAVVVVDAQPRPPGKITSVAASERVLEGVKLSNPASSDNLALIKFRDGLQNVVRSCCFCYVLNQEVDKATT